MSQCTLGGVGAGGEIPPATRLRAIYFNAEDRIQ